MKLVIFLAIVLTVIGCGEKGDTGNPDVDEAIGYGEVVTGTVGEVVGGKAATTVPHPLGKAAAIGLAAGGSVLKEDGLQRIERAQKRKAEAQKNLQAAKKRTERDAAHKRLQEAKTELKDAKAALERVLDSVRKNNAPGASTTE